MGDTTTALAVVLAATVLIFLALWALRAWRDMRQTRAARSNAAAWVAANPPAPPFTDAQFAAFCTWYEAQALPALRLDVGEAEPPAPGGSRLGGPAWLAEGEAWPCGRDGRPLDFLAQLDFAELPKIPDFPADGVLQFFIGRDDLFGADFDKPDAGNFKVIWREAMTGAGALHPSPPGHDEDCSPMSDALRRAGRRLTGTVCRHWPPISNWTLERDHPDLIRSKSSDRIWDWVEQRDDALAEKHHVGGYPDFTQDDFRRDANYANRDRVLLQLWSYPHPALMWGDCGQGNFMISRADLRSLDFSRVTYQWDCT